MSHKPRKTAEPIDLPCKTVSRMDQAVVISRRAYWRYLANTVERLCPASMSGRVGLPPGMTTRSVPKLWAIWCIFVRLLMYVYEFSCYISNVV